MKKKSIVFSCAISLPPVMLSLLYYVEGIVSWIWVVLLVVMIYRSILRLKNKKPKKNYDKVMTIILPTTVIWVITSQLITILTDNYQYILCYAFLFVAVMYDIWAISRICNIKSKNKIKAWYILLAIMTAITVFVYFYKTYSIKKTFNTKDNSAEKGMFSDLPMKTFGGGCGSSSWW